MKMLFWSVLIIGTIWWLMKKSVGAGNDLTNHFNELDALNSIGNTSLGANQIGQGNWPLATIGSTPLSGIYLNPMQTSPFDQPQPSEMYPAHPATNAAGDIPGLLY